MPISSRAVIFTRALRFPSTTLLARPVSWARGRVMCRARTRPAPKARTAAATACRYHRGLPHWPLPVADDGNAGAGAPDIGQRIDRIAQLVRLLDPLELRP